MLTSVLMVEKGFGDEYVMQYNKYMKNYNKDKEESFI